MFLRRGKTKRNKQGMRAVTDHLPAPDEVRGQVAGFTKGVTKAAGRRGKRAAREMTDLLPEPEEIAEATRRATDKLFRARAKRRRKEERKRKRRLVVRGIGLAGLLAGAGAAAMAVLGKLRKRGEAARSQTPEAEATDTATPDTAVPEAGSPSSSGNATTAPRGGNATPNNAGVSTIHDESAAASTNRRKS